MNIYIKCKKHGIVKVSYDDSDHDLVSKYSWYITVLAKYKHTMYAVAHIIKENGNRGTISMHRLIFNKPSAKIIDHIDRNGLNNCRSNLREASALLNRLNSKLNCDNTSGFRNIFLIKGMYHVKISRKVVSRKVHYFVGSFNNIEEAIISRDKFLSSMDGNKYTSCRTCYNIGFTYVRGRRTRKQLFKLS